MMELEHGPLPRPTIKARLQRRPAGGAWLYLQATGFQRPVKLIRSHARLLAMLVAADVVDDGLPDEARGWRSYDELARLIGLETDWTVDRGTIIQMVYRICRRLSDHSAEYGLSLPPLVERSGGAARVARSYRVAADEALMNHFAASAIPAPQLPPLPPLLGEIFQRRGLTADEQALAWDEFATLFHRQVSSRSGPFFEMVKQHLK